MDVIACFMIYRLFFFVCFCMINCHSLVFFPEGNFRIFRFTVFSMVLKLLEVVAGLMDLLLEPSHYCCVFIRENDSFFVSIVVTRGSVLSLVLI